MIKQFSEPQNQKKNKNPFVEHFSISAQVLFEPFVWSMFVWWSGKAHGMFLQQNSVEVEILFCQKVDKSCFGQNFSAYSTSITLTLRACWGGASLLNMVETVILPKAV